MSHLLRALATVLLGLVIAAEPVIAQSGAEKKPAAERALPDKAAADKAAAEKAAPDKTAAERPASALKPPALTDSISKSLVGMAILFVMAIILESAVIVAMKPCNRGAPALEFVWFPDSCFLSSNIIECFHFVSIE